MDSLPYLVELDNWGVSVTPGQHVPHSDWTWGRDEITWFSLLNATCVHFFRLHSHTHIFNKFNASDSYRRQWLQTTVRWLRDQDPRGHLEMPGLRLLATHPKTWCACESFPVQNAELYTAFLSGITLVILAGRMQRRLKTRGLLAAHLEVTH